MKERTLLYSPSNDFAIYLNKDNMTKISYKWKHDVQDKIDVPTLVLVEGSCTIAKDIQINADLFKSLEILDVYVSNNRRVFIVANIFMHKRSITLRVSLEDYINKIFPIIKIPPKEIYKYFDNLSETFKNTKKIFEEVQCFIHKLETECPEKMLLERIGDLDDK